MEKGRGDSGEDSVVNKVSNASCSQKRWPIKASRPGQGTKVPDCREMAMPLLHCVPFQTWEAEAVGADVRVRDKTVRSREQTELEKHDELHAFGSQSAGKYANRTRVFACSQGLSV